MSIYIYICGFNDEIKVGAYLCGRGSYVIDVERITCWPRAQSGLIMDATPAHKLHSILWNMSIYIKILFLWWKWVRNISTWPGRLCGGRRVHNLLTSGTVWAYNWRNASTINYILYCEICQYTSKCGFNDEIKVGVYLSGRGSCVMNVEHFICWPRAQSGLIMDAMPAHKLHFILWNMSIYIEMRI
jgi:hypothetical protein